MLSNLQMQQAESNGGSEQVSFTSEESRLFLAFRKMMKKEFEVMVIPIVEQVIVPVVEDLIRKVVKEEIQSAQNDLNGGTRNDGRDITMSTTRTLRLKFRNEISATVLTGKEIKGEGDTAVTVSLVDETTGNVVHNGPEASAVVEILVLEASTGPFGTGDNGCDWSLEKFDNRIIRDNDKKKPHFTKSQYVNFKEGVGVLSNVKLAHGSSWTKNCQCRLGARIVRDFGGIRVKEALTNSFMVKDGRGNLYDKHYPPSLSDELWRLDNIGKDGTPCKRLNDETIMTVRDFLFLHNTDPQRLKKIAHANLKATVKHAQTCVVDDKQIYLFFPPSPESRMGVVFNVVGETKGLIVDSHYVTNNILSEAEKACQHKLLLSAFENRKDMTSFVDEASLLRQFPCPSTDKNGSNLGTGPGVSEILAISVSTNVLDPEEAGTSSDCIASHAEPYAITHSDFHGPSDTGHPYDFSDIDIDTLLQNFAENEAFISLISPKASSPSATFTAEACTPQQSGVGRIKWVRVVDFMLWAVRARKRVTCQGDIHVSKKQKTF